RPSELELLSIYIAGQSRGVRLEPGMSHPKEKASYELGRALYFHRVGAWDFACVSCHGDEGKRIRMQELPVLYKPQYARPVMASWPAYRISTSQVITLQWRMNDCYRQMRTPEPDFGSETTVALIHFLNATAHGARGLNWNDKPGDPAGGSCYNCHELSPKELSHGTIGPSLRGFGKTRGTGPEVQRYVYGKIYNAKAYNACSQMPRLGASGTLTAAQIKDLVALLLDPASPVNE